MYSGLLYVFKDGLRIL